VAGWSAASLDQAHATTHAAGGLTWTNMQAKATAILNDPIQSAKLNDKQKERLTNISLGAAPGAGGGASDRRLKKNIIAIGDFNGIPLYRFQYLWSNTEYVGTMAQDIIHSHPHALSLDKNGYYRVDYAQLGFKMETYQDWKLRK